METPGLTEVLRLMANGVGVGAVVSFLFERFAWFQNLAGNARWWVIFGLSMGLPLAARLLTQFIPPDVWIVAEPYWQTVAAGFLIWVSTQIVHLANKKLQE